MANKIIYKHRRGLADDWKLWLSTEGNKLEDGEIGIVDSDPNDNPNHLRLLVGDGEPHSYDDMPKFAYAQEENNSVVSKGYDYAEYFKWADDVVTENKVTGRFVTIAENTRTIRLAQPGDKILGITSNTASIIGNWDESNRTAEEGWAIVGMLGIVEVKHDQTCTENGYAMIGADGIATKADDAFGYKVVNVNSEAGTIEVVLGNDSDSIARICENIKQINTSIENMETSIEDLHKSGGHSPYIGDNGNWYEWDNTTEEYVDTGITAQGGGGQQGIDGGYYIPNVVQTDENTAKISFQPSKTDMSDVSDIELLLPRGADGADGIDGAPGPQGEQGPQGNPGKDGVDGTNGIDGTNGEDGFSPIISVTEIQGGHSVSVTDINGTQSFNVMDGIDINGETDIVSGFKWNKELDSVLQVDSDSTDTTMLIDFKTADRCLGNPGGSYLEDYSPPTVATLEADGWAYNSDETDEIVANHGGTEVNPSQGLRAYYDANASFALDIDFPSAGDCVLWVNVYQIEKSRAFIGDVYVNNELIGKLDTSVLGTGSSQKLIPGSANFIDGRNTIKFVCSNYTGGTKYLVIESITIRGKQNIVTGYYSAAFGRYNNVSGNHSVAFNYDNDVMNKYSLVSGCNNTVEGHTCEVSGSSNEVLGENTGMVLVSGARNKLNSYASYNLVSGKDNVLQENTQCTQTSGSSNDISGSYSIVGGLDNIAKGNAVLVSGSGNLASGEYSIVGGVGSEASGIGSLAHGTNNKASGDASVALNDRAIAGGQDSIAGGQESESYGWASVSIGYKTKTNADFSQAFGNRTIASANGQMVVGVLNEENTDAMFIIGNGSSDTDRKNLFTVNKDKSITLGDTTLTEVQLLKLQSLSNSINVSEEGA